MASDEDVGRQILGIFMQHKVVAGGVLRRNYFIDVRDADFQRGLNKAVENRWLKIKLRDRYSYELTDVGLAAGLSAGFAARLGSQALGLGPLTSISGWGTGTIAAILRGGVLQVAQPALELEGVIDQSIQVAFAPMP